MCHVSMGCCCFEVEGFWLGLGETDVGCPCGCFRPLYLESNMVGCGLLLFFFAGVLWLMVGVICGLESLALKQTTRFGLAF